VNQPLTTPCPDCGADAVGTYCDQCGTALGRRFCGQCGASTEGASRFCGSCGTPAHGGSQPITAKEPRAPWLVATVLSLLTVALVLWAAGKRGGAQQTAPATGGTAAAGLPPDLSTIPPREQFTRLNDRVMSAAQAGDSTTVIQFWPMAEQAYHNLLPGDRDVDARYHMATLHLLVGRLPTALAVVDTMMIESPDNLLGWYLRGIGADYQGDVAGADEARTAFRDNYDSEMATGRQEYVDHGDLLVNFKTSIQSP